MIRSTILAATITVLATPAVSLSCLRPDVARSYKQAAEAEESYLVVHGTLTFDETELPEAVGNESPPGTRIRAQMAGKALSQSGFDHPFDRQITLDVRCFGPWCGGAASGIPYLAFVERGEDGYTLTVDPCGSLGFPEPTEDMLRQVKTCFDGGKCGPKS